MTFFSRLKRLRISATVKSTGEDHLPPGNQVKIHREKTSTIIEITYVKKQTEKSRIENHIISEIGQNQYNIGFTTNCLTQTRPKNNSKFLSSFFASETIIFIFIIHYL